MNTVATRNEREHKVQRRENEAWFSPEVNIFETTDAYELEGEMPGVNKDGLEIMLEGNALTIVGRRTDPDFGAEPVYRESKTGHFRRVFELDPAIDTSKISARMEQGVLKLHLPKAEKVKPRKIVVD
ncbi:MAG: Hsp20/alpha crystallin family protein [Verrucomicrobia subdivision 3 bacterium]|nr:Hsp20/alpha crystallin family protein [Limisphaerales bacterium]